MASFAKNTIIYTIGRIIPQIANFILLPIYTDYLSPEQYGIVESMLILGMIISVFLSMASERSMFRLYYDYKTEFDKKRFIGNVSLLIFFTSLFVIGLLFIFKDYVGMVFSSIEFYPYYIYTIVISFCISFSFVPQTLFQVKEKALSFIILSIGTFLLNTCLIIYFVIIEGQGAEGFLKGKMFASILLLPVLFWIIYKNSIFKFDKKITKSIYGFSIPMIPGLLTAWILNMSNRIFIEQYYSLEEVGVFSLAFKISSLGTIVLGALFTAYNPVFYKIANSGNDILSIKKIKGLNNIITAVVVLICFLLALFAKDLIEIFIDVKYIRASYIIPILLFSVLFTQLSGLLNLMIYQVKKTYLVMVVSLLGGLFSVGFNFLFVPKFGMWGAAYASVLSAGMMFIAKYTLAHKAYFIPMRIVRIFLSVLLLSSIVIISNMWQTEYVWLRLIVKIIFIASFVFIFYRSIKEKLNLVLKEI